MLRNKELIQALLLSIGFLILMWSGFYWLTINSYIDLAYLQIVSLSLLIIGVIIMFEWETVEWHHKPDWTLAGCLLLFLVVFILGCFILSGSGSIANFIDKYFITVNLNLHF